MPNVHQLQTDFTAGELDPLIHGRLDTEQYTRGLALARNVFILPQGAVRRRPGLAFSADLGTTASLTDVRLIPFVFGNSAEYICALDKTGNLKVYDATDGSLVTTLTHPYTGAGELREISWTQDLNQLLIFHEDYQPRLVTTDGTWSISTWTLNNIPKIDFIDVDVADTGYEAATNHVVTLMLDSQGGALQDFTLIVNGEETQAITYNATAATLSTNIQTGIEALSGVDANNVAVAHDRDEDSLRYFDVTFETNNGGKEWDVQFGRGGANATKTFYLDTVVDTKGHPEWADVWSAEHGWPRCGVFFQGRLWLAGSKDLPTHIWASRPGDPNDFSIATDADDMGIMVTAQGSEISEIRALVTGRHLQILGSRQEWYVPISEDEAVTPQNIVISETTSRGIKESVPPVRVNGATVFVDDAGESVWEYLFTDAEQSYQANNIALLASHLIRNPRAIAFRRTVATDEPDYVLLVNGDDDTLAVLSTNRTQNIAAWSLCSTDYNGGSGTYQSGFWDVAVAGNRVWFVTKRNLGGSDESFYLEYFDDTLYLDMATSQTGSNASMTGIAELDNADLVWAYHDGTVSSGTVASGTYTFSRTYTTAQQVGLEFPQDPDSDAPVHIKTLRVEAQLPDGWSTTRKKRIPIVSTTVHETQHLLCQGYELVNRGFGPSVLDTPWPTKTETIYLTSLLGWTRDAQLDLTQIYPMPMTLARLSYEVSV